MLRRSWHAKHAQAANQHPMCPAVTSTSEAANWLLDDAITLQHVSSHTEFYYKIACIRQSWSLLRVCCKDMYICNAGAALMQGVLGLVIAGNDGSVHKSTLDVS